MQERPHILVVDDEVEVRDLLGEYFVKHGLVVSLAGDADDARRVLATEAIDLAVIDVVMPGEDGLSLARFVRERLGLGIVMLTSAGDPIDRVVGMAVGADDYVVKPFLPREVLLRVLSVLRRPTGDVRSADSSIGRFRLDMAARTLVGPNGIVRPVTDTETALLSAFLRHANQCLSRRDLIELGRADAQSERSIDVHVARLRRKIEDDPAHPRLLRTVLGSGYMFVPETADRE